MSRDLEFLCHGARFIQVSLIYVGFTGVKGGGAGYKC